MYACMYVRMIIIFFYRQQPEKGAVLEDFLCQSLRRYRREYHDNPQPFVLLEVGTYCGYSALRMLQIMERVLHREQHHDDDDGDDDGGDHPSVPSSVPPSFRVISVDVDPVYQGVARQLVDLAGYTSDHVRFHLRTGTDGEATTLVDVVRRELQRRSDDDDDDPTSAPVRFVFLDHEKVRRCYLEGLTFLDCHRNDSPFFFPFFFFSPFPGNVFIRSPGTGTKSNHTEGLSCGRR